MTYGECYDRGVGRLVEAGVPEASLDARILLEYVCGTDRNTLLAHRDREVSPAEDLRYEELTQKRAKRKPLQHLTGTQEFMGLEFMVNEDVLVPRQDTEILVEEVLRELHDGMRILDMCTGSGCILISLLHYTNYCVGVGVDISEKALEVARRNAERSLAGVPSRGEGKSVTEDGCVTAEASASEEAGLQTSGNVSLTWLAGDLFEPVAGKFDVIVSNPPYIRHEEICGLMPEVREYEPLQALDGGADGLDFYRRIAREGRDYLVSGGMLYFEIGYDQADDVKFLMEQAGYTDLRVVKDYAGLDRVVSGMWITTSQ